MPAVNPSCRTPGRPSTPFRRHPRSAAVLAVVLAACGGGGGGGANAPTPPAASPAPVSTEFVITITASGVSPRELRVPMGARVAFANQDSRSHEMNSDPHPLHTDCPSLTVGIVNPGQTRTSGALDVARACGFHDHDRDSDDSLRGRILVGGAAPPGDGY